MKLYPYYKQTTDSNCGPACLQMVLAADGRRSTQKRLAKLMRTSPYQGTGRADLGRAFRQMGYRVMTKRDLTLVKLDQMVKVGWHVIVNYIEPSENISHYSIVLGITPSDVVIQDPWNGANFHIKRADFLRRWHGRHTKTYTHWALIAKKHV